MTIEQVCCVCIGVIMQVLTFALGLVVGASMRVSRRESTHADEGRPGATGSNTTGRSSVRLHP